MAITLQAFTIIMLLHCMKRSMLQYKQICDAYIYKQMDILNMVYTLIVVSMRMRMHSSVRGRRLRETRKLNETCGHTYFAQAPHCQRCSSL